MKPGQAQFLAHVRHNRCCTGQSRRLPRQTSTISSAPSLYSWTLRLPRTTPRHYPSLMEGSSRKHLLRSRYLFIPHQRGRDRLIPHNPLILNGSSNSRRPARFLSRFSPQSPLFSSATGLASGLSGPRWLDNHHPTISVSPSSIFK